MTTLIGFRCTYRKVLSREVLIRPFLLGNLKVTTPTFTVGAPTYCVGVTFLLILTIFYHDSSYTSSKLKGGIKMCVSTTKFPLLSKRGCKGSEY